MSDATLNWQCRPLVGVHRLCEAWCGRERCRGVDHDTPEKPPETYTPRRAPSTGRIPGLPHDLLDELRDARVRTALNAIASHRRRLHGNATEESRSDAEAKLKDDLATLKTLDRFFYPFDTVSEDLWRRFRLTLPSSWAA